MTNEQAIKWIKQIQKVGYQDNLLNHKEALEMAIKALEQESEWIPVSERLPEIHNYMQEYIVTIKGNFIRTAFFTESNGKSWWSIDNVTAWMPLPKPYEPQESEE